MKPKIEKLKLSDWDEFYTCFVQVLQDDFLNYSAQIKAQFAREARVKDLFVTGKRYFWVAKLEGKLVGFLIASLTSEGVSFVNWLGVKKEDRGRKVGSGLVAIWQNWAQDKNCRKLRVQTSNRDNQCFYEKLGFMPEGVKTNDRDGLMYWVFGKHLPNIIKGSEGDY